MDSVQSQIVSVKTSGLEMMEMSKSKAYATLQPYYVKVEHGTATIVAKVGDAVVLIKMKVADVSSKVQLRVVDSLAQAKAIIEPYSSPLISKATTLQGDMARRARYFKVTIVEGIVRIKGAVGDQYVNLKARLSDVAGELYAKATSGIHGAKDAILNLNTKLMALVASARGEALKRFHMLEARVCDGYLYVTCLVNDSIVGLKLKVSDVIEAVKSTELYNVAAGVLTSKYSSMKTGVLRVTNSTKAKVSQATEITKTKAIEAGTAVRTLVSDPKAQVTAASAAGGAVALGASGGATGFVAGGAAGAACGLPAALFTFGLSIPVGAAIGAGAGLCVGTAAGGAAGIVTGGAAGYSANKHKDEIGNGFAGAISKANAYKESAKARAMRVIGHTGGTAFA